MRDINRIDTFMDQVAYIWKEKFPDWRFGQLMSNFFCIVGDPFYYEEDEFIVAFKAYAEGKNPLEEVKRYRKRKELQNE